jgi:hypothetical protein
MGFFIGAANGHGFKGAPCRMLFSSGKTAPIGGAGSSFVCFYCELSDAIGMNHFLSAIRSEAAALYAQAHPEISTKDIGLALTGYKNANRAKNWAAGAARAHGIKRPRGAGSPAYDRSILDGRYTRRHDHEAIWQAIQANPLLSYRQISVLLPRLKASPDVVRYVGKRRGWKPQLGRYKTAAAK